MHSDSRIKAYPKITPIQQSCTLTDVRVCLVQPRKFPSTDILRRLEIAGGADVEGDGNIAYVHPTSLDFAFVAQVSKGRRDQVFRGAFWRFREGDCILDDKGVLHGRKNKNADGLEMSKLWV